MLTDYPVAASAGAEMRPEWARSRMYEAFLDLLRRLAADGPVVLAIEDLHWADDSTRELLAFLVRNAQAERLLLLVTFRSDELTRRHPCCSGSPRPTGNPASSGSSCVGSTEATLPASSTRSWGIRLGLA